MKATGKDAYKAVYNWQVVHSIDFWSLVLSTACDKDREAEHGESVLRPLIYPLVEVTLGIARCVANLGSS
jgi:nucleolar complex protein 2